MSIVATSKIEHYGLVEKNPRDGISFVRVLQYCLRYVDKIISGTDENIWFDNYFDYITREEFLHVRGFCLINNHDNHTMIELLKDMRSDQRQFVQKCHINLPGHAPPSNSPRETSESTKKSSSHDVVRPPIRSSSELITPILSGSLSDSENFNSLVENLRRDLDTRLVGQTDKLKLLYHTLLFDSLNELLAQTTITYDTDYGVIKSHVFNYISDETKKLNSRNQSNTNSNFNSRNQSNTSDSNQTHNKSTNARANLTNDLDMTTVFPQDNCTIQDDGRLYERDVVKNGNIVHKGLSHNVFLDKAKNIYNFLLKVVKHCTDNGCKLKIQFQINENSTNVEKLVKPRNIHIFQVVRQFVEINKDYNSLLRNRRATKTYTLTFVYKVMAVFNDNGILDTDWGNENPVGVLIEENKTISGKKRTKQFFGQAHPGDRWRLKGVKGIWRAYGGTRKFTSTRKFNYRKFRKTRKI